MTCGVTTAVSLAAHGRLGRAIATQPLGAALALGSGVALLVSGYALARGVSVVPLLRACWRPGVVWGLLVLVLGSWAYKAACVVGNVP